MKVKVSDYIPKELQLTESQLKRFEKLWFVYGNSGSKSTLFNHKLVQGFLEYKENRIKVYVDGRKIMIKKYGKEEALKMAVTDECVSACVDVLNNP